MIDISILKMQLIFFIYDPYSLLSPDKRDEIYVYFFLFRKYWLGQDQGHPHCYENPPLGHQGLP